MSIPKEEAGSAELDPWGLKNWGMSSWAAMGRAVGCGCLYEVLAEAVRLLEDKDTEGQLCQRRDPLRSQGDLAWGWVSSGCSHWLAVCLGASYSFQGCLLCQQSLSGVGRGFFFFSVLLSHYLLRNCYFCNFYDVYSAYSGRMRLHRSQRVR